MEVKKVLAFFEFLMFFSQIVLAQETQGFEAPGWARAISGLWIIVLVAAFILISVALIARKKGVLYAGIIVLYISIILIIIGVLLPIFGKPTVTYEECKSMFAPDVSILTMPGLFYTTSCIFTGYVPQNLEWLTVTTFIIFGIILPLALLISLFFSFIPDFMITDKNARRVIAVVGALFAFRGFFATFFIQILEYGFVGIGALMVGTLFTGFVWKAAEKFISPLGIKTETALKIMKLGYYEDLEKQYRLLMSAKQAARKQHNQKLVNEIEQELAEIEKELKKVK
jgi:hypothetical protein